MSRIYDLLGNSVTLLSFYNITQIVHLLAGHTKLHVGRGLPTSNLRKCLNVYHEY